MQLWILYFSVISECNYKKLARKRLARKKTFSLFFQCTTNWTTVLHTVYSCSLIQPPPPLPANLPTVLCHNGAFLYPPPPHWHFITQIKSLLYGALGNLANPLDLNSNVLLNGTNFHSLFSSPNDNANIPYLVINSLFL